MPCTWGPVAFQCRYCLQIRLKTALTVHNVPETPSTATAESRTRLPTAHQESSHESTREQDPETGPLTSGYSC